MQVANRESFAAASRRRLPYDAEVEYLQSTGTQYIDTGVVATASTSVMIEYNNLIATGTSSNAYFGARKGANNAMLGVLQYPNSANRELTLRWDYGNSSATIISPVTTGSHSLRSAGRRISYDSFGSVTAGTFSSSGLSLWLFAINNNGSPLVPHVGLRVSSLALLDGSIAVRDYIPVRVGTTGEMYDRITGTFATRVGTFIVGPDK